MKWCTLLLAILISVFSPSFGSSIHSIQIDTTSEHQRQVHALLDQSKAWQWIDSYTSLSFADQALTLSLNNDYQKGVALAHTMRAFSFWSFGDNDLAIQAGLQAMEYGQNEKDIFIQAQSCYILARGYMDLNELNKAMEYIDQAEQYALLNNNAEQLCSIYNLKGVIHFIANRQDSALYFYNKAYEIGKANGVEPIQFPRIISNIGECYATENPALAFTYFNQALELAKETNNKIAEASITSIIAHVYLERGDLTHAEPLLQKALHFSQELGLRRVIRHAYAGLVDIKLKQGKGEEAVQYQQRYYAVRDSLLNSSKIRQIVELEAAHALQIKEQHLQLLEKEKHIQVLWKNLLIVLVISLIFISTGIYFWQRYRYQKNRELLNLEIDYLTQQNKETVDKYQGTFITEPKEALESHDQKLLKRAISIVELHLNDPQFGVEKMAQEMMMSRTNLHRKIKSITGFPPSELIRSIRLRKAAKLILNKVDSVSQIAQVVGFDDYSHFSKAFKKHFGVSPTNYGEPLTKHREPAESAH